MIGNCLVNVKRLPSYNALDISVQFSRYTGIFVFWNALPAAGPAHCLSQTVHYQSPGMTIAGFFRFVLISEFTPFLQDLCFISHDDFRLGFSLVPEGRPLPPFSLRDGATIKLPPPKTPSQSSQPSRIVARQGFSDSSAHNRSAGVCGKSPGNPKCWHICVKSLRSNETKPLRLSSCPNSPLPIVWYHDNRIFRFIFTTCFTPLLQVLCFI